jgi:hypothetical protein
MKKNIYETKEDFLIIFPRENFTRHGKERSEKEIFIELLFLHFHRNRLESNSEHWNALLLSLREMTEWVIRKDTELTTIERMHSPVRGDAAGLAKMLVSFRHDFDFKTIYLNFLS